MFAESVRKFLPNFPLSTPQSDKSSARTKPVPNKLDDLLKSLKRLIIFHFSPFNLTSQRLRRLHSGNGQGKKLDFFSQIPFSCELAFLRAGIAWPEETTPFSLTLSPETKLLLYIFNRTFNFDYRSPSVRQDPASGGKLENVKQLEFSFRPVANIFGYGCFSTTAVRTFERRTKVCAFRRLFLQVIGMVVFILFRLIGRMSFSIVIWR